MTRQEKRVLKIKEIRNNCQIGVNNYILNINDKNEMIMIFAVLGSDCEYYFEDYNIRVYNTRNTIINDIPCYFINIDNLIK